MARMPESSYLKSYWKNPPGEEEQAEIDKILSEDDALRMCQTRGQHENDEDTNGISA